MYASAYTSWTPEQERDLRRMVLRGMNPREIGAALGRNRGAVTARMKKMGLGEHGAELTDPK